MDTLVAPKTVVTKTGKKQLRKAMPHRRRGKMPSPSPDALQARRLEQAALELEECIIEVLDTNRGPVFRDVDFLYFDRQLKNIAASVSLALAEYRGPQRFHNHFRHDAEDYDVLHPVYEPPLPMLVRACREALVRCNEVVGLREQALVRLRNNLEHCLRSFLQHYNASQYKPAGQD